MGNDVIIIILKHGYGTDPLVHARVLTGRYLSSDVTVVITPKVSHSDPLTESFL